MAAMGTTDVFNIKDGTTVKITKPHGVDDKTWAEVREYLEGNPETAKNLQKIAKDPNAIRGWLQTQEIAKYYQVRLEAQDTQTQARLKGLEQDPELAVVFEDLRKNGLEAMMKYQQDEELMLKINEKMGGLPAELKPALQKIEETPLSIHEAAKNGDLKKVKEYLDTKKPLDVQDHKGITPLGYAIGTNRIAVAKLLLDSRANPHAVDASGNSGLHYAAGYGRKELLEYLLKIGVTAAQTNSQGQTPLAVATTNRQESICKVLQDCK